MNKKNAIKLLAALVAVLIIVGGYAYIKKIEAPTQNTQQSTEANSLPEITEVEKNSDLDKIKLSLISKYVTNYQNVSLPGGNLIDGSRAKRTVWIFAVTNMKDLAANFRDIIIYDDDSQIPTDKLAIQYNEDDVIVVVAADNTVESEHFKYAISVNDPKIAEIKTFDRTLTPHQISYAEDVYKGMLFNVGEESFWVRQENGQEENEISKNGDNGPYFEYIRTLNFLSIGKDCVIDESLLELNIDTEEEFDYSIHISENNVDYKHEANIGTKTVIVTLKFYTSNMNDVINEQIKSDIDRGYIKYNDAIIHLSDGILGQRESGY